MGFQIGKFWEVSLLMPADFGTHVGSSIGPTRKTQRGVNNVRFFKMPSLGNFESRLENLLTSYGLGKPRNSKTPVVGGIRMSGWYF